MQPTDIKKLMAGMRFEPKTRPQWEQAEAGAAAMDAAWEAKELPAFVGNGMRGANRYYRAAYELRYHEIIAEFYCRDCKVYHEKGTPCPEARRL